MRAVTVVGTTALLCVPMVLQAASLGSAA
ncbi:MAG: hypothetical protein QOE84_2158, partial [Actinomycetota bacterium]|nr:hypothetical protein [Actinomycetota bacterium]